MGPYGRKKFQNTTPPSNYFWIFQTTPDFSSHWSPESTVLDVLNFEFLILMIFFRETKNCYYVEKERNEMKFGPHG